MVIGSSPSISTISREWPPRAEPILEMYRVHNVGSSPLGGPSVTIEKMRRLHSLRGLNVPTVAAHEQRDH